MGNNFLKLIVIIKYKIVNIYYKITIKMQS